jgi:hypothetical protein
MLTKDEARRIARNVAKLPIVVRLFQRKKGCRRLNEAARETECAQFSVRAIGQPSCCRQARFLKDRLLFRSRIISICKSQDRSR